MSTYLWISTGISIVIFLAAALYSLNRYWNAKERSDAEIGARQLRRELERLREEIRREEGDHLRRFEDRPQREKQALEERLQRLWEIHRRLDSAIERMSRYPEVSNVEIDARQLRHELKRLREEIRREEGDHLRRFEDRPQREKQALEERLQRLREIDRRLDSAIETMSRYPEVSKETKPEIPTGAKDIQEVLFATNRLVDVDLPFNLDAITDLWSSMYHYGRAWISIPGRHRIGVVERPKFKWLRLRREEESPDKHFMLSELAKLTDEEFVAALRSHTDSVLVFVHGYNVSFVDALFRAAQIAFDANFTGKVIAFSWPSCASTPFYDYDRENAKSSDCALLAVLKQIKFDAGIENIFLVAHSLGSEVVISALQMATSSGVNLDLREVIFAAPDVDRNFFSSRGELIKRAAGGVTLYASSADKALIASKIKAGGLPRAGDMPKDGPLLIDGIDLIDVTAIGEDMFGLNHSVVASHRSAIDDLGRIITSRTRPPHVRTPTLERMPDRNAPPQYWRYPY
jgi:esterase/lipase superfamily enzyme